MQRITLLYNKLPSYLLLAKKTFSITPIACKQKKRLPLPVFQIKHLIYILLLR